MYPDLLGTYGDGGNGLILARRARSGGARRRAAAGGLGRALPEADIYCLGGGEDGPQVRAARTLIDDGTLVEAGGRAAPWCWRCVPASRWSGARFPGADGDPHEGVGLLDIETVKGAGPAGGGRGGGRAASPAGTAGCPSLTGFENHGGATARGRGHGRAGPGHRGRGQRRRRARAPCSGRVVGTYLHGPVLARNPALADLLLAWALDGAALAPLDDAEESSLRAERLAAARAAVSTSGPKRWLQRWRRLLDGR